MYNVFCRANIEPIYNSLEGEFLRAGDNMAEEWRGGRRSPRRRRRLDNNAHFISLIKLNLWPHSSL